MSGLTTERDWMRKCADDASRPESERDLWRQLADEVDAYLAHDPDVVTVAEPSDEDAALWEEPC